MPFEVKWYVEGRVSSARDWGDLTLEEMRQSNVISLEHIRTGTPPFTSCSTPARSANFPAASCRCSKRLRIFVMRKIWAGRLWSPTIRCCTFSVCSVPT